MVKVTRTFPLKWNCATFELLILEHLKPGILHVWSFHNSLSYLQLLCNSVLINCKIIQQLFYKRLFYGLNTQTREHC